MSSLPAGRIVSGISGTIIVPMPWCVKSSMSRPPSTLRLMRCERFTPCSHARIVCGM
jgi:hypothetical protein